MSIETSLTELKINVLTKAEFETQLSLGNIDSNEFYITEDGEYSPIDSPNFIGTPTAPTAISGTNTTQLATTAFVQGAMSGAGFGDMLKGVYDKNNNGIVDNAEKVNGFTVGANVPAGAKFTDTVYSHPPTHPASMITDLPTGKKVARFVVGTSTAGWTAADCDYLCDGTADQTEINAAITALPATGGEIVILDGTYNITAKIDVTKDNVSIRGNGNATILKRMFDSASAEGVITLTGRSDCKIANLQVDGNKTSYTHYDNSGIYLYASSNNTVTGNTCNNNSSRSISLSSSSNNNTVTGNTCYSNGGHGIYLYSSSNNNTVTSNTCYSNTSSGISLSSSSNNTVTGNTCNNNTSSGIYLYASSNNTVTGNACNRGTGLPTDYTESQHTIRLASTKNNYNLIVINNCMGKAVTNEGGTGNTLVNNKFDAT